MKKNFLLVLVFLFAALAYEVANSAFYQVNKGSITQSTVVSTDYSTTNLVATSNQVYIFEGTGYKIIKFPSAAALPLDWYYDIINNSSSYVTVRDNGGNNIASMDAGQVGKFISKSQASANGSWKYYKNVSTASLDALYYLKSEHINASAGAADAGKPIVLNSSGLVDSTMIPSGGGSWSVLGNASTTAGTNFLGTTDLVDFVLKTNNTERFRVYATGDSVFAGNVYATRFYGPLTGDVTGNLTGNVTGAVTGNADTATALAANPADCAADTYATTIAASGALTCASITNASTTATASNTNSTIVLRDGSGNFAAGTITAALTGNSSTATALAANPSDCSSNQFANAIAASGNLTCSALASADLPAPTASAISALDIDWSVLVRTGGVYTKTLGANSTFTFSNQAVGTIVVRLTNTASNYTVTWPSVQWCNDDVAPTMTTGAKSDVYTFIYDGTNTFGCYTQNHH
jgi:hypothetical protein